MHLKQFLTYNVLIGGTLCQDMGAPTPISSEGSDNSDSSDICDISDSSE